MDKIENLLQQVSFEQRKYDEIAKITGENFNIFSVMNMETDEVKTHSAIIGELLNPQGSHGQGSVFLDLFIEHLKNKFNKNHENIKLNKFNNLVNERICERTISISNNWVDVTGGRIDIIIEDEKQICIIETKINAEDQGYQLIRYQNYAKNRGKRYYIFYLTKDGKTLNNESKYLQNNYLEVKPAEDIFVEGYNFHYEKKNEYEQNISDNKNNPNIHQCIYYPISFSDDIKDWLEKCLEKTVSLPIIRETLVQYLYLIKKLTDQTINNKMRDKIIESMKTDVIASFEISRNIEPLKSKIYYNFFDDIIQFSKKIGISIDDSELKSSKDFGLYLKPEEWNSKPYKIAVIFDTEEYGNNYSGLYVGLSFNENISDTEKKIIQEKFDKIIPKFGINQWNIWRDASNRDWANNPTIWEDIAKGENGNTFKEIISIIEEIIEIEKS